MKKTFKALLSGIMVLTMAGCNQAGSGTGNNNYNSSSQWSEEHIVEEAIKLENESFNAVVNGDYDRFAACFDSGNEEAVHNLFTNNALDYDLNQYSNVDGFVIDHVDNFYFVNVIYYNVAGTHPNTSMDSCAISEGFKVVDGTLKKVSSEADVEKMNNHLMTTDVYPDYVIDALNAGRNASMFNGSNYMYVSSDMVYDGHSQSEIKFASQEGDGSVLLMVWIANGTNQNLHYTNGTVTLTDDQIGTIVNANINIDEIVPAHSSTTMWFSIPANEVYTGTAVWGSTHSNITAYYDL